LRNRRGWVASSKTSVELIRREAARRFGPLNVDGLCKLLDAVRDLLQQRGFSERAVRFCVGNNSRRKVLDGLAHRAHPVRAQHGGASTHIMGNALNFIERKAVAPARLMDLRAQKHGVRDEASQPRGAGLVDLIGRGRIRGCGRSLEAHEFGISVRCVAQ
jgi:hypothetical protein